VSYTGSLSYTTGSFVFTERTHSFWLSNGLTLRAGPFSAGVSLPLIAQNSDVVSLVAGRPVPTGGAQSGVVAGRGEGRKIGSRAGSASSSTSTDSTVVFRNSYELQVGDPLLSGSWEVHTGLGFLRSVGIQGGAKPPVRSLASGVGTGAWDVGGGLSMVVGAGGALLFGDCAYWSFGDLPDLELDGGVLYSVSVSHPVMAPRGSVLFSVTGSSAVAETLDAPLSVGGGFLYLVRDRTSVSVGASVGLTEASPDFSSWVGWSVGL